jgi:hypothetical protein
MAARTAAELLADVRRLGGLPTSATLGLADSDILAHADITMESVIVPHVLSQAEEYFVAVYTTPLVSGQAMFRMPPRNVGGRLRDVQIIYGSIIQRLPRLEPENQAGFTVQQNGLPYGFYLQAGNIILLPAAAVSGSLQLLYFAQPGRLTTGAAGTAYGVVTGATYSGTTCVITYTSGSNIFTSATTLDVIASTPPYGYLAIDAIKTASGVGSVTVTNANISPHISVGDIVTLRETSPIIQAPNETFSLYTHEVALRVCEALKHSERIALLQEKIDRLRRSSNITLSPRVDGEPQKVIGLQQRLGRRW